MLNVVRLLFWLWFFGSLGLLTVRLVNKRSGTVGRPVNGRLSTWETLLGKRLPDDDGAGLLVGSSGPPAPPGAVDRRPPVGDGTPASGPPDAASADTVPTPPAASAPATDGADDDLWSGAPPVAAGDASAATPARTVAEALQGVEWPCGLTPVIDLSEQHAADRQVSFSTTDAGATEVGRRLHAALAACGYELEPTSDTVAEARRPGTALELRVHPEAGRAERAGRPLYPSLPPRAVVVAFTLRPR